MIAPLWHFKNAETASVAYDGSLLPVGVIDPTKRYLRDKGKLKQHLPVEGGQGALFNGVDQRIPFADVAMVDEGFIYLECQGQSSGYMLSQLSGNRTYIVGGNKIGLADSPSIPMGNTTSLYDGEAHQVYLEWSSGNWTVIIDQTDVSHGTYNGSVYSQGTSLGGSSVYTSPFSGLLKNVIMGKKPLTLAKQQVLFTNPEAVIKTSEGFIIPDLDMEDSCALYAPLCDTDGFHRDMSKFVAPEIVPLLNPHFETDASGWLSGWIWTESGMRWAEGSDSNLYQSLKDSRSIGDTFIIGFDCIEPLVGSMAVFSSFSDKNYFNDLPIGHYESRITITADSGHLIQFNKSDGSVVINNVTIRKVVPFMAEALNFTDVLITDGAQKPTGAQTVAWERDSNGVLLGMRKGLYFDSTLPIKTNITLDNVPVGEAIEVILNIPTENINWCKHISFGDASVGYIQQYLDALDRINVKYRGLGTVASLTTPYSYLVMTTDGVTSKVYLNNTLIDSTPTVAYTDSQPIVIGGAYDKTQGSTCFIPLVKVHMGMHYQKFDIDKAWAKAQKTIATLEAN